MSCCGKSLAGMAGLVALMGTDMLSLRQAVVPNHLLGRVSSSLMVLVGFAMPIGARIGGFAIERTQKVALVFGLIGATLFATGVAFMFTPLRHAERYVGSGKSNW